MAGNEREIDRLRALAKARQRAVGNKISRLRSQHNVEVGGSKHDPRRKVENIDRYNAPQLRAHLARLDAFMSRKTQFVPDAHRRPIDAADWRRLVKAKEKVDRMESGTYEKMKDVYIPESGMTVGQRKAATTADHPRAGQPRKAGYRPTKLSSRSITSARALKKLIRDYERKGSPEHFERRRNNWRKGVKKMADLMGLPELWDDVKNLTNDQFDLLWGFTNFATAVDLPYLMRKLLLSSKEKAFHSEVVDQHLAEARRLLDWAKKVNLPE